MTVRDLLAYERATLERLLSEPFQGVHELRQQLLVVTASSLDANGSLSLDPAGGPEAVVKGRIPVEAEYRDADGVAVHVLLHVQAGQMCELEVYRDDSGDLTLGLGDGPELAVFSW